MNIEYDKDGEPIVRLYVADGNASKASFEGALFDILDQQLSPDEATAAKGAIKMESRNWIGSCDWGGVAAVLISAALHEVARTRAA